LFEGIYFRVEIVAAKKPPSQRMKPPHKGVPAFPLSGSS
jgi:hypothetical protein